MTDSSGEQPANPTDTPDTLGFQSDEDLHKSFESLGTFLHMSTGEISARLQWIMARQQAAFVVYASGLDIDLATVRKLFYMQHRAHLMVEDLLSVGLDIDTFHPEYTHPLQETLNDLIDEIADTPLHQVDYDEMDRVNDLLTGDNDELFAGLELLRDAAIQLDNDD